MKRIWRVGIVCGFALLFIVHLHPFQSYINQRKELQVRENQEWGRKMDHQYHILASTGVMILGIGSFIEKKRESLEGR